jgi:hypothetical protein
MSSVLLLASAIVAAKSLLQLREEIQGIPWYFFPNEWNNCHKKEIYNSCEFILSKFDAVCKLSSCDDLKQDSSKWNSLDSFENIQIKLDTIVFYDTKLEYFGLHVMDKNFFWQTILSESAESIYWLDYMVDPQISRFRDLIIPPNYLSSSIPRN